MEDAAEHLTPTDFIDQSRVKPCVIPQLPVTNGRGFNGRKFGLPGVNFIYVVPISTGYSAAPCNPASVIPGVCACY
jgi:hypothetical protein